jgi:hypothetical protein
MDASGQIHQLKRQLNKHSLGPVAVVFDEAASSLRSVTVSATTWLRHKAYDQPFVTLLLSFQAGYAVARLGRRYARR